MEAQASGLAYRAESSSGLTPADIAARGFWSSGVIIARVAGTRHFVRVPDEAEEFDRSFCNGCGFWLMKKTDDGLLLCAGCGERQVFPGWQRAWRC